MFFYSMVYFYDYRRDCEYFYCAYLLNFSFAIAGLALPASVAPLAVLEYFLRIFYVGRGAYNLFESTALTHSASAVSTAVWTRSAL